MDVTVGGTSQLFIRSCDSGQCASFIGDLGSSSVGVASTNGKLFLYF